MKFTILVASITCAFTSLVTAPSTLSHSGLGGLRTVHVKAPLVHASVPVVPIRSVRPSWSRGLVNEVPNVHPIGLSHETLPLSPKAGRVFQPFLAAEKAPQAPKKGLVEKVKDLVADGKRRDKRAKQNARNKLEEILDNIGEGLKEPQMIPIPIPVNDGRPRIGN